MDANQIRLGETGFEELLSWLRQSGRPQTLDSLTYQYVTLLRDKVLQEEQAAVE
jgi:hypothetical protein